MGAAIVVFRSSSLSFRFSGGNVVEDFTGGIGTKSIVAASNRIIHQLCGFPHRGDGAITLAAFAMMITISSSPILI
jgi:hypothetical protein